MTKEINTGVEIVFADGKKRNIKPLTIKQLRKFMKSVSDMDVDKQILDDEDIDRMVDAVAIALEKADPELAANRDELEDVLNLKTFNDVFAVAMGNDPNV